MRPKFVQIRENVQICVVYLNNPSVQINKVQINIQGSMHYIISYEHIIEIILHIQ